MGLRKDIWRPAIVEASFEAIVAAGTLDGFRYRWLPDPGPYRFLADPFGLWRDGRLYVFVEAYDYRIRVGTIELLVYDRALDLIEHSPVLAEPWHLSYPQLIEADGETWLLPEAQRSGTTTLYRAVDFPHRWEPAARLALDTVPIDATPVQHDGRWWLFYAGSAREADKMAALHVAFADRLEGPWTPHPANPIRIDRAGARPGGSARVVDGMVLLPVQDCSRTYGGALHLLYFPVLTPDRVVIEQGTRLTAPAAFAPYVEGLHTLSAAGPVTLVDAKRTLLTPRGLGIEVRREWGKLARRLGLTSPRRSG